MAVMWLLNLVLLGLVALSAAVSLGGGFYEYLVVDPFWPQRPGIIQPTRGGISRRRFWIPVHSVFEVLLIVALIMTWGRPDIRVALLVALVSHVAMRIWSLVDFVPKALAFEKADPSSIDTVAALRWTRRSIARMPLDLVTCGATLTALALA